MIPTYIKPEKTPSGPVGRYSPLFEEASRLVKEGKHATLFDAFEALGVDLDRAIALHTWEGRTS